MRIHRIPSLLTVSTTILTAALLISASLETPPNPSSTVKATQQNTKPSRVSSPQPPSGFPTPLAEQRLAGGYWRIDHTFQPSLIITNVLQNVALPVTPLLYAADGTEYQLSPITLAPAGVVSIDIRAALAIAPEEIKGHFSDYGSSAVKYVWHWPGAATALVDNRDGNRSLNFNFELKTPMLMQHGASATVQEGLWWREDSGVKGFLALVNVAPRPVSVQVRVLSDYGAFESERTIQLQTNETRNLDLLGDANGSSGGIRVAYQGTERDVVVAGGLENPQEGYSAQIPFVTASSNPKPANIGLSSVGLMLGAPDPMMKFPAGTQFGIYLALRNTSSLPILVTPTLYYMDGANPIKTDLNKLALAAGQAKHWAPQELATELGLPNLNGMVNLMFSYQGGRNDVIMANGSIDQTKSYVFEIKMEGVSKSLGKGLKDWDVSNGNDTMISVLNPGDKDEDLSITFYFDGGHYKLPVHLNVGGSAMFNVSEVIMMQQPDSDGNKIPPGTLHGTAVLSAASADPQWINVGVSVGIFNVSTATCGGHCPYCTNFTSFLVQADIGTAPVGQDTEFSSWALSSGGSWVNYTLQSQWTSSNIQVAQPSASTVGAFTGVSPGSFVATASATLQAGGYDCPDYCDTAYNEASAPGTITPTLTSVSPPQGPNGATVAVTLNGNGFGSSPTINAGSNITVSVTSTSNTQIQANLSISGTAPGGNQAITVTVAGQTSNAVNFFIQIPTSLTIVAGTDSTTSEAQCSFTSGGNQYTGCGVTRSFTYQINDQTGQPLQFALAFWDSFGTVSPNPLKMGGFNTTCTPANTGPCGVSANAQGQFLEKALSVCSTVCYSNGVCTTGGPSVVPQTWHIGAGSVTQTISYYCNKVLVNGQ
ncbi:MAG: hypothetical protein ACYDHE_14825 [Candidatus Acidiferrales bacterium]